jgi:hypothetical protein
MGNILQTLSLAATCYVAITEAKISSKFENW